ncbi:hypothetical protein GCM10010922_15660 [Microbacterium sorbitolivorans]|uniref:hypothetical protein n=1 Tax=Microbacterium sorbitolivorans TaxID=1867410 RepID=UPI0013B06640|nr:hypothetical protein [Microbacterium sorbitolivorans]GGF41096.1 hypothetical protein GCM10010922_15660 [Microbacterium sorbitolivorans]
MSRNSAWFVGVVALVGLAAAGCDSSAPAADPDPDPTATDPSETASADPVETETPDPEIAPVFVGDDLEKVILDADQVAAIFPSVTGVGEVSDYDPSVGETEGQIGDPATCMPLLWSSDWALTVGVRSTAWTGTDAEARYGSEYAVQAPSIRQAEDSLEWFHAASESCTTFTPREDITDIVYEWTPGAEETRDNVDVIVGTLAGGDGATASLQVQARAGNALVSISVPAEDGADPQAIATSVADALESAIGELTVGAASLPAAPAADGATPLADWQAGSGGIGPIRIGDTIDDVQAAVDWLDEPVEGENYFVNANQTSWSQQVDGGTLGITFTDDRVSAVTVQADYDYSAEVADPDGSALPTAGGVRIGDTAVAASEAFPGGTVTYKLAPGVQQYGFADASGMLISFSAPGLANQDDEFGTYTLENGIITSIAVEDTTTRVSMYETYTAASGE